MKLIRSAFRTFLFLTSTLGLYAIWWIFDWFIPNKVYWRQVIFGAWTTSFVKISKMTIEIHGTPPKPPFFLVSNHLGYTDIAALRVVTQGIFVAKREILDWFLAGRICRDMGTIFIDRSNRRDIPRAGGQIMKRLGAGEGVIVFPEGTSTKGEAVLPFNSSFLEFAAKGGVPVSYAAISYQTPSGGPPACDYVCWWEDISFFAHIWRLFKLDGYTAVVSFGEEPLTRADRKALAAELRSLVVEKFTPVL
ncbi:MAG: lysophospholipid acyltransferase family protein [Acidobacteriota bacterium]